MQEMQESLSHGKKSTHKASYIIEEVLCKDSAMLSDKTKMWHDSNPSKEGKLSA